MLLNIQYIVDNQGNKVSVIVPYTYWEKINLQYRKRNHKLDILKGIRDGVIEIKQAAKEGKNLQTLSEFLHEYRNS